MREFLEKDKVRKKLDDGWAKGIYPRNDIMLLHTSTEHEIVKPYLEKLKEQINVQKHKFTTINTNSYVDGYDDAISEVLDIIDNILSEQEKEE